jgi:hypothetical protein
VNKFHLILMTYRLVTNRSQVWHLEMALTGDLNYLIEII